MATTGDVSYKAAYVDPLRTEIALNVPKETVGPRFQWHPDTEHLQIGLQGQHRSYRAATRDAVRSGIEPEELVKIGAALSSPTVTLEDVTQMRKRLADTIVLWDMGVLSDKHGTGRNLLPSYDISNEHATLANTLKNVSGARFSGSKAELSTLDKLLAEYGKIGEILRQMYAVRMSYQAESVDNALECIVRARSIADDDLSAASAKQRAGDLAEAQSDMAFVKDQLLALSALFKALYLTLPSILASRVLPDSSAKGMERETSSLASIAELQKIRQQADFRAEYTIASASSSAAAKKTKPKAKEKWGSTGVSGSKSPAGKQKPGSSRTPVSRRPPSTPTSGGADKSVDRTKQQKKNAKRREKRRARSQDVDDDGSADSDGDLDSGRRNPPAGGSNGGTGSKPSSGSAASGGNGGSGSKQGGKPASGGKDRGRGKHTKHNGAGKPN